MRNKEKYTANGAISITYNDRIPNVPYLFANTDINYNFNGLFNEKDRFSLGYNLLFVNEFFRSWKSQGGRIIIPTQLSHDISLEYTPQNKKYSISVEARNITDELLYDNFSLQKPTRAFYMKLRYYFL